MTQISLFKLHRGNASNLPVEKHDGYVYFTKGNHMFYIDYTNDDGELVRATLNAKDAETLAGATLSTILSSSDVEIPTSKAVMDALTPVLAKLPSGSVALTAEDWTGETAPYTQTVAADGMTEDCDVLVSPVIASKSEATQLGLSQISCTGQDANSLTFTAFGQKPNVGLNYNFKVMG